MSQVAGHPPPPLTPRAAGHREKEIVQVLVKNPDMPPNHQIRMTIDASKAALINLPYLAWVSFASVLNWTIVKLNAPFARA